MSLEPPTLSPARRPLRWWHLVLAAVAGSAVTGLAIYLVQAAPDLVDSRPEVVAKLYAPVHPPSVLGHDHPDQPMDRATHVALIKSQLVLAAALRPPEIANLPVVKEQPADEQIPWLAKNLVVEFEGPEVICISLKLGDPEQARLLVDAVQKAYLEEIHGRSARERKERFDRLTDLSARADESLKQKQIRYRAVSNPAGVGGDAQTIALRQKMAMEQLQTTHRELAEIKRDIRRLRLEEAGLNAKVNGAVDIPQTVLDGIVETNPEVVANLQTQAGYEEKVEAIKKQVREPEKRPDYVAATTKLTELKQEYQKLREKIRARAVADHQSKSRAESATRLQAVKEQLTLAMDLEMSLLRDIPTLEKEAKSIVVASGNLDVLKLEVKLAEELSSKLKVALTSMSLVADVPPRVMQLEKAMIRERE